MSAPSTPHVNVVIAGLGGQGVLKASDIVALAAFDYPDEVEPIAALLAANGIAAFQFLDDGRDFDDKGDIPTCTRLLVPQDQFRRATALVERAEQEARAKL